MGQKWAGDYCQNFETHLQKCVTLFREGMKTGPGIVSVLRERRRRSPFMSDHPYSFFLN